jgi:hypothetical protein
VSVVQIPKTLSAVITRVENSERAFAILRSLDEAVRSDPMLKTIGTTGVRHNWTPQETAAYMILSLLERARHAEKRIVEARMSYLSGSQRAIDLWPPQST